MDFRLFVGGVERVLVPADGRPWNAAREFEPSLSAEPPPDCRKSGGSVSSDSPRWAGCSCSTIDGRLLDSAMPAVRGSSNS